MEKNHPQKRMIFFFYYSNFVNRQLSECRCIVINVLFCKKKGVITIGVISYKNDVPSLQQVRGTPADGAVIAPGESYYDLDYLKSNVEQLREQLVQLFLKKNDFLDEEVVQLSQKLDQDILGIQLKMMQKKGDCV
ncbi:aspartyl-phosphate phosphatase Spo0E family protein [Brevibacillus agri]|uniref:Spo0E family sporulation regulatory protein-aspartic acid phosphatase n=1 Tax=Brevibacillus agri TaxID=51101 RepID=UPI003D224CBD